MSEPAEIEVDDWMRGGELNETEINEWTRRSLKEGLCGILNCYNKPTSRCQKCTNYYCHEHFESHIDIVPDGELAYQKRGENSLDYYT